MIVSDLAKVNNICVDAYTNINEVRKLLQHDPAVVVKKEDEYFGLITLQDIGKRSYNMTVDYVQPKPSINPKNTIEEAFEVMSNEKLLAIPVINDGTFLGVVYKNDLVKQLKNDLDHAKHLLRSSHHDIRGNLGIILNGLEILLLDPKQLNEENKSLAKKMLSSVKLITEVSTNTLSLDQLDKPQNSFREVDLNEIANGVFEHVQRSQDIPDEVEMINAIDFKSCLKKVNPTFIKQLIINLMTNAIKFTEQGHVKIKTSTSDNNWILEISDTGIGIPESKLDDLFKPYSTYRRKGIRGEKSTGLGLSICKKIVEAHNGTINVKSKEGTGSSFTVHFMD